MMSVKSVVGVLGVAMMACASWAGAADIPDIALPAPRMEGGMPLMQALRIRQSSRAFSTQKLPVQVLSDLLWVAAGVNRPDSGKRTVPSARNWQEVEVYVVMEEGGYRYDAKANVLKAVAKGDLRKLAGRQDFVATAPLNLVYVGDPAKMEGVSSETDIAMYLGADTAFMSQNVYLFCASEGLATVVRAMVDREELAKALGLSGKQRVTLAQTVGYPGTTSE